MIKKVMKKKMKKKIRNMIDVIFCGKGFISLPSQQSKKFKIRSTVSIKPLIR